MVRNLIKWIRNTDPAHKLKLTYVVHGSPRASHAFRASLLRGLLDLNEKVQDLKFKFEPHHSFLLYKSAIYW